MLDRLFQSDFVPERVVRLAVRQVVRGRLRAEQRRTDDDRAAIVASLGSGPISANSGAANEQHYTVPAPFFQQVLGRHVKYSCNYWPRHVRDLDSAEAAALDLVIERAGLGDGQSVLELGCGWGSLSLLMAVRFPASLVTALSNSSTQAEFIRERAVERKLDNLKVITADIADFDPGEHARFDRVVSVEMFEHVRNYAALLDRIGRWLEPTGQLFVHVFAHRDYTYLYEDDGPTDWMAREFFTGGVMPSRELIPTFAADSFDEVTRWSLPGTHYQKTANAWLANLQNKRGAVIASLAHHYGGPAEGAAAYRRWRLFLIAVSELFGFRRGVEWGVMHYLLAPRG